MSAYIDCEDNLIVGEKIVHHECQATVLFSWVSSINNDGGDEYLFTEYAYLDSDNILHYGPGLTYDCGNRSVAKLATLGSIALCMIYDDHTGTLLDFDTETRSQYVVELGDIVDIVSTTTNAYDLEFAILQTDGNLQFHSNGTGLRYPQNEPETIIPNVEICKILDLGISHILCVDHQGVLWARVGEHATIKDLFLPPGEDLDHDKFYRMLFPLPAGVNDIAFTGYSPCRLFLLLDNGELCSLSLSRYSDVAHEPKMKTYHLPQNIIQIYIMGGQLNCLSSDGDVFASNEFSIPELTLPIAQNIKFLPGHIINDTSNIKSARK